MTLEKIIELGYGLLRQWFAYDLFNMCMKTASVLDDQKSAGIVPLFREGKKVARVNAQTKEALCLLSASGQGFGRIQIARERKMTVSKIWNCIKLSAMQIGIYPDFFS